MAKGDGLFETLLKSYGRRGWWPLPSHAGRPGFDANGYHPGSYDPPSTGEGRFEIAMGAVLTQNTAWRNVEKALANLRAAGIASPRDVLEVEVDRLAEIVRPSGCFNVKARKLVALANFMLAHPRPDREALLAVWGVGPETADSILLYAFGRPHFVIDAYSRRVGFRLGMLSGEESYDEAAGIYRGRAKPDAPRYNEEHALLVEHAKRHCSSRPRCDGCPLSRRCPRVGEAYRTA